MAQNKFKGLGIALITPFKSDGEVDYEALTRLVEYQIRNGVDFLCIMGTTAETPCLSADEKKILKKILNCIHVLTQLKKIITNNYLKKMKAWCMLV